MLLMLMMLMMLLMMLMLLMLVVVLLMMLMLLLLVEVVVMMVMVIQRFIPHIVVVAVVVAAVAAVVVVVVDVRARAVADALETLREDVSRPAGGHDAGRHDAALDGHGRQILINRRCRVAVIAPAGGKLGRGRWNDVGAGVVGAGDVSGWPWGWRRGGRRR